MNKKRRNQILVGMSIIIILGLIILLARISMVCCAFPPNLSQTITAQAQTEIFKLSPSS